MSPSLRHLMFWALLPLTALQGLWLRSRALRLPGATGAREGTIGKGENYRFLAIGDSIIDGVGAGCIEASLPVQFAAAIAKSAHRCVHWRVAGASGDAIQELIDRVAGLQHDDPVDLILVSVGVNDVTRLSSIRHWRRSLKRLLEILHGRWPDARILFAGLPQMENFPLPPQPLRWSLGIRAATLDLIAKETVSAQRGAVHVPTRVEPLEHDFCEDGFHPSAESCTLWARELAVLHSGSIAR